MKINLLIIFFIILENISFSQEYDPYTYQDIEPKLPLKDKIFFGGEFGLQLGAITVIKTAPEIGYKITKKLSLGTGLFYMYYKNSYYNYSDKIYGGKVFTRFFPAETFFTAAEYELLNVADITIGHSYDRIFVEGLLVGGGWYQKIGKRFAVITSLMYNLKQSEQTPYQNPVFKVGFAF